MVKLQFLGSAPIDVDCFPQGLQRSVEGSVHFKPRKVKELTEDEYNYLKDNRKDLKFYVFKPEVKFQRPVPKKVEVKSKTVEKSIETKSTKVEQKNEKKGASKGATKSK